ncbi:hypothetical protein HMPREF2758_08500 [Facklamia sp. HMSC062C11]|uniref:transporter substrate-binding domain-containing protein n=1 Tax=Facklamia TaxID=66831 RepID=UPI0008A4582A|nr:MULTISPECIES: transporter substrate-binding domain-containing protein [Facklamia]OFL65745.1 hypothetical protein HMPREF2758_08500 [Facklamia sp. HMSC062C11]PKY93507.1 amino acid ABC transporter substrate-binding protein [Facklamia hominis]
MNFIKKLIVTAALVASVFVPANSVFAEGNKLIIGTEGTYKPFTYHDDNDELVGFDVEVGRAIAEELGMEVEFMEVTWEGLLASIDNGKVDMVINQVAFNEERDEKFALSNPYMYSYPVLIVKKDNEDVKSFEDTKGLKTSLNVSSNYAKVAEKFGIEITPSETFNKDIELLLSGRTDVVVNGNVAFADFMTQKPDTPVKVVDTLDEPDKIIIPMKKDNTELQEKVNKALDSLRESGKLAEISKKYLNEDLTKPLSE